MSSTHSTSYDPVASSVAENAMSELKRGGRIPAAGSSLVSLKHSYSSQLLDQFYNQLMIPNFPLKEERDDLDDWKACLDPIQRGNDDDDPGPDMDILLLLVQAEDDNDDDVDKSPEIAVGLAFEYYKRAQTGLLSYIVTAQKWRRKGLVQTLHPVVLEALSQLHRLHQDNTENSTTIRAIFCETNTIYAGDASPGTIRTRHKILHRLGYRQLEFPYVQPALEEDASSFDDIMLLIHCPEEKNIQAISSSIPYDYILDFFLSVHGGYHQNHDNHDLYEFSRHWYFQLAQWFAKTHPSTRIVQDEDAIWDDVTDQYQTEYINQLDTEEYDHVCIIGAGVAGLEAATHLAKQYDHHPSSNQNSKKLHVTLLEASPHVGGRIRTVLTDISQENEDEEESPSSSNKTRQYIQDRPLVEACQAFTPWPVVIGGEFLHGTNSAVNKLAVQQKWHVEETFDLDAVAPEEGVEVEEESSVVARAFLDRPETKLLSADKRQSGHVKIFGKGQLLDLRGGNRQDPSMQDTRLSKCLRRAEQLWEELIEIAENIYEKSDDWIFSIPQDQSLQQFAYQRLEQDKILQEDQEFILGILESLFANTAGSSNDHYGVNEASREEYAWEYTERNFRTRHCFGELISHYLDEIEANNHRADRGESSVYVRLVSRCPVKSIEGFEKDPQSGRSRTLVHAKDSKIAGDIFRCDKVIVTASLGVLKSGKLKFCRDLALPKAKEESIARVNMFSGVKAHMLLKKGVDIGDNSALLALTELIFCPGETFSQIWLRRDEASVFITGFAAANCRDMLEQNSAQGKAEMRTTAQRSMLDQLARIILSTNDQEGRVFLNPEEPTCSAFLLHDWSDDEYVMGMYSSPSIGAGWKSLDQHDDRESKSPSYIKTSRDLLAMPIADTVFFAGEHTNIRTSATVQAALETGTRSADEVLRSLL